VYRYFRNWRLDGICVQVHDRLRDWVRVDTQRAISPSEAIIDSQSVKSAAMVSEEVGYDAGKNQRTETILDSRYTPGWYSEYWYVRPMSVNMFALASRREGGKKVLKKVKSMGDAVSRLNIIWVDGGYSGNTFLKWVTEFWILDFRLKIRITEEAGQNRGY